MDFPREFANGVTVTAVRNPVWGNADHTALLLEIQVTSLGDQWIPFSAMPTDSEIHGRELFVAGDSGEFGAVVEYVAPQPSLQDYQKEFDSIWPDVLLGLATDEEIARAKWLRAKIKELSS